MTNLTKKIVKSKRIYLIYCRYCEYEEFCGVVFRKIIVFRYNFTPYWSFIFMNDIL